MSVSCVDHAYSKSRKLELEFLIYEDKKVLLLEKPFYVQGSIFVNFLKRIT